MNNITSWITSETQRRLQLHINLRDSILNITIDEIVNRYQCCDVAISLSN
jgi:hypothetical protein